MVIEDRKIRVLVVDDSAVMRKLIPSLLDREETIEVVGTAIDGDFALNKLDQLRPDVVTMDVEMPRMDGLSALKQIVARHSIPVVMLSSFTTRGAALTMKALEIGAVDFICKPKDHSQVDGMADELIAKVKAAAQARLINLRQTRPLDARAAGRAIGEARKKGAVRIAGKATGRVVAIGASSGGPHALRYLLPRIPADFGAGIVVVQHMPESFTSMLAHWLNEICEVEVREAVSGDIAFPGTVLIAPGNAHMKVVRKPLGPEVLIERSAPVNGHMPSVDVLFQSVAREYKDKAVGIILTGMGSDGAAGIGEMKRRGAHTIAQDRESCAIYGMPRVAVEKGFIERIVPLSEMAAYMISTVGRMDGLEAGTHADIG
ncbi:MAG TPA: chemotaxis response regulator protein-glutamate methylesterase [Blastocatellia bacterium]|nr:chemotaxis response regulator protein-glutamate methylesterase [Blastocatellia bacterium]